MQNPVRPPIIVAEGSKFILLKLIQKNQNCQHYKAFNMQMCRFGIIIV